MQPSCALSHRTTVHQTSDAFVDLDSKKIEFTALRYHEIIGAPINHKTQDHVWHPNPRGVTLPSTPP